MLHPILVTAEKSPLLTAAEVMKHRNEKRPLTPDFCRGILASSGNPGVAAKLLQRIEMHLADYPEETSAYVPVLGALWFRSRHHARNMEVVARISLNGISASLAAAAPVLSAPASSQDQNASAAVSIFPASASSQNMTASSQNTTPSSQNTTASPQNTPASVFKAAAMVQGTEAESELAALLMMSENLSPEQMAEVKKLARRLPPLPVLTRKKLEETVFLTKLAEDGCHDVKTEVAARTEGNPDLTFRAQQILVRQGKLQYDENCSDAWNFCAMGFLNMGELGDYPASEMYNRLMQQPDCEMQDYPLSVLAGIGHIRCSEGFASEQRLRVLHLVGLLEQGNKPVRWLQYPDLCYKAVSGLSVSLATGGVCRSGMQDEGIAKEFSAVFSRLLHIYSRDTETGVIPRTETDAEIPSVSKCLGLLLEAQCGRREKDADFVADIAVNYWLLRQSDLLALTFDYAASRNVLDKIVDERSGLNVYQLQKPPAEYLSQVKSSRKMYDFLKGFRVHADEEQTIDDFPELALHNIAAHDFFRKGENPEISTRRLLIAADANFEIARRLFEEEGTLDHSKKIKELMLETVHGLVRNFEIARQLAYKGADDIYERLAAFCADEKYQYAKEGYNSHYVAAVLINHRVSENSPLQDLSFAKPQKAAGILAKIRAAQLQHTVAPFADAAAVSASSSAIASNSAVSRRGHNAGAGVCSPKPEPGAEQKQEQTGNLFSRIKNQLLKRRQHGRW